MSDSRWNSRWKLIYIGKRSALQFMNAAYKHKGVYMARYNNGEEIGVNALRDNRDGTVTIYAGYPMCDYPSIATIISTNPVLDMYLLLDRQRKHRSEQHG